MQRKKASQNFLWVNEMTCGESVDTQSCQRNFCAENRGQINIVQRKFRKIRFQFTLLQWIVFRKLQKNRQFFALVEISYSVQLQQQLQIFFLFQWQHLISFFFWLVSWTFSMLKKEPFSLKRFFRRKNNQLQKNKATKLLLFFFFLKMSKCDLRHYDRSLNFRWKGVRQNLEFDYIHLQ